MIISLKMFGTLADGVDPDRRSKLRRLIRVDTIRCTLR